MFNPYLTVIPLVIGLVALAIGTTRRWRMFRRRKIAQLQQERRALGENWFVVQDQPLDLPPGVKLSGSRMMVAIGTFGGKRGVETLLTHYRDGMAGDFGSIGIFEASRRMRSVLKGRVPDALAEMMVYGDVPEKQDGFDNDPPPVVKGDVGIWGPDAQRFVEELVQRQRTKGKPSEIISPQSMGGHAYVGAYIIQELHKRLPKVPIFAVVNLAVNEDQREWFLDLKSQYEAAGVKSFLIGDSMMPGSVTQDSVIADLFAGFTAASIFSDFNSSFNNVTTNVGNLIQFSYVFGEVVARPVQVAKNMAPEYIVSREEVKGEARRLVSLMETGQAAVSVEGPISPKRHQTYDLVLLQLHPDDVRRIRDDVEIARDIEDEEHRGQERPHLRPKGNYRTVYAPWVQAVDPDNPRCQIAVIRLRALRNEPGDLEELVKFPRNRKGSKPPTNGVVPDFILDDF